MGEKQRASGIELLRIIAILGVIILHYNGNYALSLVPSGSAKGYLLQGLEALFICAVNLFVLISGYFLCASNQRRSVKVLELVVQAVLIGLLRYLIACGLGREAWSIKEAIHALRPNNYFLTYYVLLYLLSPYLNVCLDRLTNKKQWTLTVICLLIFSLWPSMLDMLSHFTHRSLTGMYTTNVDGSQYGYGFLQFVLMYLLGATIRKTDKNFPRAVCLWGFAVCVALVFFWQFAYPGEARAYNNPLVVAMAVFAFLLFRSFSFYSPLVNGLAAGTFTCFLFHDFLLPYTGIPDFVGGSLWKLSAHIAVTAVGVFLVCWLVWSIYRFLTVGIFRRLSTHLGWLDRMLSISDVDISQ